VTGTTNSDNFPTTPGAFETTPGFFNAFVTKLSADGSALEYSTFITAPAEPRGIAVDRHGNAFVTGHTTSADFPTTPGAYDTSHNGGTYDVFLSKLNAAGSDLVYSTLLGGSSFEGATALTVGGEGSAYLTGNTASPDFPTTPGAFQAVNRGGNDIFVTRFNPAGSRLVYSTLLGSDSSNEFAYSLALDRAGNAYTTGRTDSAAFPTTPGTAGTGGGAGDDAFLSKVSPDGKRLLASTLIGGGGSEVGTGVATNGRDPYLAGITRDSPSFPTTPGAYDTTPNGGGDAFVMKLDPTLSRFAYSTLLGGAGGDSPGGTFGGHSLEVQRDRAHVTGQTGSSDFPATPGSTPSADGVFVTRFDPTGSQVTYSTVIGGSSLETSAGIALAAGGRDAYVAGMTDSSDFPTTAGAYDTHHDGTSDGFVAKLPLLPGSTTGCKVSGSGRIEASNGDRAKFAVGVRAPSDRSAQGVVQYSDKGPQERFKLFSFPIDALVCTGAGATITGEAIARGEAVDFTIDVLDGGKTSPDTFRLRLSSGYDSGTQTVDPGSVRVQAP
jgi:hypothetical protein